MYTNSSLTKPDDKYSTDHEASSGITFGNVVGSRSSGTVGSAWVG